VNTHPFGSLSRRGLNPDIISQRLSCPGKTLLLTQNSTFLSEGGDYNYDSTAIRLHPYLLSKNTIHVVRSLSVDAAKTAVQSSVSTRPDYCNSLMYGIADGLMQRLQAVQNAAARLINGARRRDHISPVLRKLHWLPVRQRVQFKLAVLVFKALHGQFPQCLTDDCQLVAAAGRPSPSTTVV